MDATQSTDRTVFRRISTDGRLQVVTASQARESVDQAARALLALGLERDAKIGIIGPTGYEWVVLDLAAVGIGGVTVGIYPTTPAREASSLLAYADCAWAFVEDRALARSLVANMEQLPALRGVVLLPVDPAFAASDGATDAASEIPGTQRWDDFLRRGAETPAEVLESRRQRVLAHDVASIVFSSGTSGDPKGAVLSHAALLAAAQSARASIAAREGDETLLFLPLAHVFARLCVYVALLARTTTVFSRGPERLMEDLPIARPHWLASSPRLFEKFHAGAADRITHGTGPDGWALRWALRVGEERTRRQLRRQRLGLRLRCANFVAWLLVYRRVRRRFGGRLRFAISGSAPLAPATGAFLHAMGVLVLEGIGMTENASFSHVNRFGHYRFGWVGQPGPGIEQRIAPDGEVLIRGANLMREYYRLPAETRAAIDAEGWLHTGDVGEIDDEGFLRIIDRKKDLLITAGGKNVAPAPLERRLTASPLVAQAQVIGDRRSYLTALIVANTEAFERRGIDRDGMAAALAREIESINVELPRYRRIKRFAIVPEFTVDGGLLTPTAKQRRGAIEARYRVEIEAMYRAPADPDRIETLRPEPTAVEV